QSEQGSSAAEYETAGGEAGLGRPPPHVDAARRGLCGAAAVRGVPGARCAFVAVEEGAEEEGEERSATDGIEIRAEQHRRFVNRQDAERDEASWRFACGMCVSRKGNTPNAIRHRSSHLRRGIWNPEQLLRYRVRERG